VFVSREERGSGVIDVGKNENREGRKERAEAGRQ
jgi:hypothetical protein